MALLQPFLILAVLAGITVAQDLPAGVPVVETPKPAARPENPDNRGLVNQIHALIVKTSEDHQTTVVQLPEERDLI